jgi:hypothetical protein
VKTTNTSTTPVPGGEPDKLLRFQKTYPHENKLRNQQLSAAERHEKLKNSMTMVNIDIQQDGRTKTKGSQDQNRIATYSSG